MNRVAEDLKIRTKAFLLKVLDFIETLPRTGGGYELSRQLIRAGMGVAGNYRSSCRSRSHAEFTARLGVVLEEADESELWLDVADSKGWGDSQARRWLLLESRELRALFAKSVMTAPSRSDSSQ
jgi:four helix bundle protein